jgi:hypothetical protein
MFKIKNKEEAFVKKLSILIFMIVLSLSFALFGCTQKEPVKEEIAKLKEGQETIKKELQEIKKLLQARQAPRKAVEFKETVVNIDNDPFKGDKLAKVTIIDFSDYQ